MPGFAIGRDVQLEDGGYIKEDQVDEWCGVVIQRSQDRLE
jgi:hypothetical protein